MTRFQAYVFTDTSRESVKSLGTTDSAVVAFFVCLFFQVRGLIHESSGSENQLLFFGDYDFRCTGIFPTRDYVCGESSVTLWGLRFPVYRHFLNT